MSTNAARPAGVGGRAWALCAFFCPRFTIPDAIQHSFELEEVGPPREPAEKEAKGTAPSRRPSKTAERAARGKRPAPASRPASGNKYFVIRDSPIQGRGAFAIRPIRRGTRIIEYTGEVISHEEADRRYDDGKMGRHHTFLFSVSRNKVIDAGVGGNEARFINHSCAPNCEAVDEKQRIYIEAIRDIALDEELAYDYAYERDGTEDEEWERVYVCKCGAPTCRGTILAPKKQRGKK